MAAASVVVASAACQLPNAIASSAVESEGAAAGAMQPPCGPLEQAKQSFLASHGQLGYGYGGWLDEHWHAELGCRLGAGQHYLDMTGAGMYANSQIAAVMQELTSSCFGNPHSRNPSSSRATAEVVAAREAVLRHFNADPEQYHVVFTRGATESLKMVGEYFPWHSASHFVYTQANHKSVLGMGAYARSHGARLHCVSREGMDAWLGAPGARVPAAHAAAGCRAGGGGQCVSLAADCTAAGAAAVEAAAEFVDAERQGAGAGVVHHLVAFPAKCNYEGQLYPLHWIEQVHAKSDARNRYAVVLDAAAFAATHHLDLSVVQPEFVTMSFYKMFGYPTGLGALLVRKDAAAVLRKTYFGGGSVSYCTAEDAWAVHAPAPAGLEDGTLGFLNIAALKHGFALLQRLGGIKAVSRHVETLRLWTYEQLRGLTHDNGAPLLRIFGAHEQGHEHQGAIFQFQVLTPDGDRLPGRLIEATATAAGLHIRTGCNCNPGRCLYNLGIRPEEERARAAEGHTGPMLVVMRPRAGHHHHGHGHGASHHGGKSSIKASILSASGGGAQPSAGHDAGHDAAPGELVPVALPLGSVRVSYGALSTFEDAHALVSFIASTFVNFSLAHAPGLEGELAAKLAASGMAAPAAATAASRIAAAVATSLAAVGGEASDDEGSDDASEGSPSLSPASSTSSLQVDGDIKAFWA